MMPKLNNQSNILSIIDLEVNEMEKEMPKLNNQSNILPIIDLEVTELGKEICKVKNWSDQDIIELMKVLSADQIDTILKNEIQRIDDWFSKTYFRLKSYLLKGNFIKWDKHDFENLKNKIDIILGFLNEDSKFQLNTIYSNEIIDIIKKLESNKYDKCTVQIIDEYSARCLLCKRKVDGNNLDEHILGKKHQKNLDDILKITALDSFHAGWSNIPISLRLTNEIHFLPHSENEIECCICNKNINYRELIAHVETHQVIPGEFILSEMVSNNPVDEELLNTRSGLINQEIEEAVHLNQFECDVCKIVITCSPDEFRKHFTEKDHLQNVYKLYQNQAKSVKEKATDNQIECAVCKIFVLEAKFQAHIKGKNHQSKLKRAEKIKLNQVKHPLKKDSELLFEKVKTNQTKCEICKIIIRNDLLLSHIHGKKHKNNLIEWNLNLPPDEKSDQNQIDDDISEIPCKRRRLQEDITEEDHQRTKPVQNRLQEQLHSQSIEESNDNQNQCKETENDPHDHINSHESNLFQEYLKPFEQICDNQIQCNICQVVIPRNLNYEAHQNATAHQANAYQLTNLKVKQKTRIKNQVYCVVCKQSPKDSNRLKNHVHGTNHRNKLIDINVFLLRYVNETIDIPVQLEEDLISNNMNVSPINPRVYLTDAYTLYLTKDDIPRPLTIQKISPEYFKCLVCKILFLENSLLNDHVVSDTHQRNYNDKYKQLALISFHTLWRSVPPIIQGQQIFFYPHDRKNIYCILCSLTLDCVFIKSHCKNKVHVQGVKDGGHLWSEIDESLYHKISAQYK